MVYLTQEQDTLLDVAYNTVGSLYAIDYIMDDNNLDDYSISFPYGMSITVNGRIQNNAAVLRARKHPYNSSYIEENKVQELINNFKIELANI